MSGRWRLTAGHSPIRIVLACLTPVLLPLVLAACSSSATPDLPEDLSDLPITVIAGTSATVVSSATASSTGPAHVSGTPPRAGADDVDRPFVILFSGDGGWATLVEQVSRRLAAADVPVVGIASQKYFWTAHDPDAMARDIERIVAHYSASWHRRRFVLAGFSFGADAVPFAVPRLNAADRSNLVALALLSPLRSGAFEFHISGWLHDNDEGQPIAPEITRLGTLPIVCLFGSDDARQSLCTLPELAGATVHEFKGDHHLGEDYDGAAKRVLGALR